MLRRLLAHLPRDSSREWRDEYRFGVRFQPPSLDGGEAKQVVQHAVETVTFSDDVIHDGQLRLVIQAITPVGKEVGAAVDGGQRGRQFVGDEREKIVFELLGLSEAGDVLKYHDRPGYRAMRIPERR